MAKVKICANAQPESVVVETKLTPAHFEQAVVQLVDKDGKPQGFYFGLKTSGETEIRNDGVTFVGKAKNKKLVATASMSEFGATVEDAKLALGGIVAKVTALEKQMEAAYKARVDAAATVVVEQDN